MDFNDFWINNNGKKEQLNNAKHGVRKEQVDKKHHNLFDAYDVNGDGTLEENELQGLFTGLTKFSGTDKTLDIVENKQVASLFADKTNIKDADFMGFVKSVSDATEEIVLSERTKGADGGEVITTTYKNGLVETIYYYPDGEFKLKTQKQDSVTESTTYVYTNDGKEYKQCSQAELDKMIKDGYKRYRAAEQRSDSVRITFEEGYRTSFMKAHDVIPQTNRNEIHIDNTDLSERAKAEAEIRDYVLSHYVQTHKDCQSALDTMGILDDIGAAINAGAGELWNSCKNVYNKHFGNGTESDYQNFYELVKKFEPNYDKALEAEVSLEKMRVHPVGYFTGETGRIDAEKGLQFQQTTERYQNATILKARIDILKDAMLEISMYENEQNALTYAPAQSEGMNPASHILKANNLLLQYFDGDKEAVNMLMGGTIGNAQSTINTIKGIVNDTQKMFDTVTNGKTFDQIKNDYKTQYKEMYGTDFVPDELTEKVMDAKATGGMVKLAAITAISVLITKSPVMAEISAATGGVEVSGTAANMIRTLASRYGASVVQQGIKFAMTSGTLATDVGLTLLNQVTSERGVDGEELMQSAKGSAKYIYFGAYVGAPLAQAVSKQLGKIGATAKMFEGGVKSANGAIQTTSITGKKLVQNFMKGGKKVLTTGGAFLTDVAAFSALEVATEGMDLLTAGKEQTEMLGKLKIMNHFIEYMLGGKVHAGMSKAKMDAAIEQSGVKNWEIKEIKTPNKTTYEVEVAEGLPPARFEDKNQLATAMLEKVAGKYSETQSDKTKLPKGMDAEADVAIRKTVDTNPSEQIAENITKRAVKNGEFDDTGMRLNTPERLDAELKETELNPNKPVDNLEVLSLIINGKLNERLNQRYDALSNDMQNVIAKHNAEFVELANKYSENPQKFADEVVKILSKEFGMGGLEPPIEFVNSGSAMNYPEGKIQIDKNLTSAKSIVELISHEFTHLLQFRDVVSQYGIDGVKDIIMNDPSIADNQRAQTLENVLNNPYNKRLIENANKFKTAEKGSIDAYLREEYKHNLTDTKTEGQEYLDQTSEREAYFVGSGGAERGAGKDLADIEVKTPQEKYNPEALTDIDIAKLKQEHPDLTVTESGFVFVVNGDGSITRLGQKAPVSSNLPAGRALEAKNEMIEILSNVTIKTISGKEFKLSEDKIQKFVDLVKDTRTAKVLSEYINKYKEDSFQAKQFKSMLKELETPEDIETFVDIIETPTIGEALKTPDSLFMRAGLNDRGVNRTSVEYLEKVTEAGLDKLRGGSNAINFEEIDSIMKFGSETREILSKIYTSKLFSRIEFYKLFNIDTSHLDLTNLDRIDAMIDGYKWVDSMTVDDAERLLNASPEELNIIDSRNLLKTIPNREKHLTGSEALELARVDDATWAKIQERDLLQDFDEYENPSIYFVKELASEPENLWTNIQSRNLLKIRPNGNDGIKNLYKTPDFIKRVASLTDESYFKYKELFENPTEEIFLIDEILQKTAPVRSKSHLVLGQKKTETTALSEDVPLYEIDENVLNQLKSLKTIFGDYVSTEETARVADRLFSGKNFDHETCEVLKDFIKDIQQYSNERLLCQHQIFEIFDSVVDNSYMEDISRPREGVVTLHGLFRFSESSKAFLSDIQAQKQIFEAIKNNEFEINRADNLKILKFVNKNNVENIKTLLSNRNLSNENIARIIQQNTGDLLTWISSQDLEPALAKLEAQRQKVEEKPELYINGEANDEFSINYEIGKIFDKKYAKFLTLCTIYDKEAINNLLRMRINDTEEYLYTMDEFGTKEFELLKGMSESVNIDGKPFMPTQKIEFIDLLNSYRENNLDMAKIQEMVQSGKIDLAQLNMDLFHQIMKNSGLTDEEIASIPKEKLVAWDTKYAHLLSKEISEERDIAFSDVLRAGNLAPDFNEYIHDTSNVYGQANAETRSRYGELGLNYDKWVKPSKEHEVRFVSKDANTEQLQQVAAQITEDMNTLMQTPVKGFLKKQFPKFIKGDEFVIPNEYLSNKTKLQQLVKILSDTSEQGQMAAVWNRAKGNAENPDPKRSATARGTLTILDHLNQRLSDIDNISEAKIEQQRDWTVKMWDRIPQKDIFQGNYSTCCIGMGGGNGSAMPHFVMNTAYNMIEIVDNVSGKTVGNALCYFITGADGKPAFIVDNIEINNGVKPSGNVGLQLRDAITQYAANVSREVTGSENASIYMSSSYNDVPCNDLPRHTENINFLGDIDCDEIYMDLYKGWVNKDEFASKQELLKLK